MILSGAAALIWLAILLLPWQPWRNGQVLERTTPKNKTETDLSQVTVVIPARDEAAVITETLGALVSQGEALKVILVNDRSSDGTVEAARLVPGLNLRIIQGEPLPSGWAGKIWALEQGMHLVETPMTLLLDADIKLAPGVISMLQAIMQARKVQFSSIMAAIKMQSFWEKLLNPAFIFFFKLLYPFRLANSSNPRFAAAAGGCIMLETGIFKAIGGLESIKGEIIDDCAFAKAVKTAGYRTWIGQSQLVTGIRPYSGLGDIWNMVARSAYTQLRYNLWALTLCTFIMLVMFWAPVFGLFVPSGPGLALSLIAWFGMIVVYLPTLRFYRRSPAWAALMPLIGGLYLAMTWHSAIRYWRGERSRWKGRVYQTP